MKAALRKIVKILKKPLTGIILCLLGVLLIGVNHLLPNQPYVSADGLYMINPLKVVGDGKGHIAVNDYNSYIYIMSEDSHNVEAVLTEKDFGFKCSTISNLEMDENGYIAVYVFEYDEKTGNNTGASSIVCFDSKGRRINSDNYTGADPSKLPEIYNYTYDIKPTEDGYIVISYYDEIYKVVGDDTDGELLVSSDFNVKTREGYLFHEIGYSKGRVYVIGGVSANILYTINDGLIEKYAEIEDFISYDENIYEDKNDYYFNNCFVDLYDVGGRLAFISSDKVGIIGENKAVTWYESGMKLPVMEKIIYSVRIIVFYAGIVLAAIGLFILIGGLMGWHFSILSKQLVATVPLIVVIIVVLLYSMIQNIKSIYYKNEKQQLVAVSELVVRQLDTETIANINTFEDMAEGEVDLICSDLCDMIGYNEEEWSKQYVINLYRAGKDDRISLLLTDTSTDNIPLTQVYYYTEEDNDDEVEHFDNSDTVISNSHNAYTEFLDAMTPIYYNEEQIGYLNVAVSTADLEAELEEMLKEAVLKALGIMLLLVLAIVLINIYMSRGLKKARSAISGIAAGNFSSRANNVSKDEIGEICAGVDHMAGQLEAMFEEKDKNEQFYYKFVPEQFTSLLKKEHFTDLELGDAQSADLTVLFCDIRSFSLNSEMMTAKENFEFVNVIYGIAGPIIREHNGFVDKYIGDAVMALFENADDAVAAGMDLYAQIVLNPETAKNLQVGSINIGIGIHSGMARVGIVGEEERMSGTVISNTVNISSRLETLTKQIHTAMLISKETLDRCSDPDGMNTRYLGMIQVAGVNEVKAVYEVLDCLDEERREDRTKNNRLFREAVRMFHLGELESSVEMFKKVKDMSNGTDPVIDRYISYIQEKLDAGDFEHNVFRFSRK